MATAAEVISIIKDVATGSAAVVGACVAVAGLRAWQRQLRGKTYYELARRLLRAVYRIRDGIRQVRDPSIFSTEIQEAMKELFPDGKGRPENPSNADTQSAVYGVRWSRLGATLSELRAELLEAEVSWGKKVVDQMKPLYAAVKELGLNIRLYLQQCGPNPRRLTGEQLQQNTDILYSRDDADADAFAKKVDTAVEHVEAFLRPYLSLKA